MRIRVTVGIAVALLTLSCRDATEPSPNFRTVLGCEMDPACGGGGGGGGSGGGSGTYDPDSSAPGYWMGSTVTPAACISITGAGISDRDDDALADHCETYLGEQFRPSLRISVIDCDAGMEPYWAAKAFPDQGNVVRIAYLFSYYRDCGVAPSSGAECTALHAGETFVVRIGLAAVLNLPFSAEPRCDGHQGDSEFITVDLRYNGTSQHWYVASAFYAAHFATDGDASEALDGGALEYPNKGGGYPRVWVAHGKHGSYRSRTACNNGGAFDLDDCNESYAGTDPRMAWFGVAHNVGSNARNAINPGTCVQGGRLVQYYPNQYGLECYWQPGNTFAGWSPYPIANDASPYHSVLMAKFECYSLVLSFSGGIHYECTDWGVQPSQTPIL